MFSFSSAAVVEAVVGEVGVAVLLLVLLFLVKSQRAATGAPPNLLLRWTVKERKNKGSVVGVDDDDDVEAGEEEVGEVVLVLSIEEWIADIVKQKKMTRDFVALLVELSTGSFINEEDEGEK